MTTQKLIKPCPFCGSRNVVLDGTGLAEYRTRPSEQEVWVECLDCKASGPVITYFDDKSDKDPIIEWNKASI